MGEEIEVASEGEVIVVASVVEEVEEIAVDEAAAEVSQMPILEFRSLVPIFMENWCRPWQYISQDSFTNFKQAASVTAAAEVGQEEGVELPEEHLGVVDEEALEVGEAVPKVGNLTFLCKLPTKIS